MALLFSFWTVDGHQWHILFSFWTVDDRQRLNFMFCSIKTAVFAYPNFANKKIITTFAHTNLKTTIMVTYYYQSKTL